SGLRILHSAWRSAHRPPPVIVSDRDANNFTVTLDWRPLADPHDEFGQRLGVKLTASQAKLLNLVKAQPNKTADALGEAVGLEEKRLRSDLDYLEFQRLLECHDGHYTVAEHL